MKAKLSKINIKSPLPLMIFSVFFVKVLLVLSWGDIGWEPDSYMHYLELNTVFSDLPENIAIGINVWSKPLYTYLLGGIVFLSQSSSLIIAQLVNIFISLLISLYTYRILKDHYKVSEFYAIVGFLLTSGSFLLFRSSTSVLTEPIFLLFVLSSFYYLLKDKILISSLLVGISLLGRLEGFIFITILAIFIILDRKYSIKRKVLSLILLVLPGFMWNLLGYLLTGRILYLIDDGYPREAGVYGFGNVFYYFRMLLKFEPILFTVFTVSTLFFLYRIYRSRLINLDKFRLGIPWIVFWSFFTFQTLLWTFGLFGTAGLSRYFVPVIPYLVIGSIYFLSNISLKNIYIAALVITQVVFTSGIILLNGTFGENTQPEIKPALVQAGEWIRDNTDDSIYLFADRPSVIYYANRNLNNSENSLSGWDRKIEGIYVWSAEWGLSIGYNLEDFINSDAELLASFDEYIYIFYLADEKVL